MGARFSVIAVYSVSALPVIFVPGTRPEGLLSLALRGRIPRWDTRMREFPATTTIHITTTTDNMTDTAPGGVP